MDRSRAFSFIDLFAGIGGFRLAMQDLGGVCIGFSEIDKDAINHYCANFDEEPKSNFGDIKTLRDLPAHDILTAGVPCQSWSIAGRNRGFDDDRGQLWNDTIYLLNRTRPKAFIFENVKGLADPRNREALTHILQRIAEAGYHARHFVLNSSDFGVPQNRVRVYIIGFLDPGCMQRFQLPRRSRSSIMLSDIMDMALSTSADINAIGNGFSGDRDNNRRSIGATDYFLFNDIRNGPTTIHSWDLVSTTERERQLCLLLLRNRRKQAYGVLDGNPLSIDHFRALDSTVTEDELESLVSKGILKKVVFSFTVTPYGHLLLDAREEMLLSLADDGMVSIDRLKDSRPLRLQRVPINQTLESLVAKGVLLPLETRYEFRYTKISTGIEGVNRVFLPRSRVFPTLVASDTNDFVATKDVHSEDPEEFKCLFLEQIYLTGHYRKLNKQECCVIQGFPRNYLLPESRSRWMKLLGNSVSVPVIRQLVEQMLRTGVLELGGSMAKPMTENALHMEA